MLDGYTVLLREGFGLPAPLQVPLFSVTKDTAGGLGGNWLIGLTVQIPFELQSNTSNEIFFNPGQLYVSHNSVPVDSVALFPVLDQIHFLTSLPVAPRARSFPLVVHGDASLVTPDKPARAGEVLVAYVVGLGLPENPPPTGAPATKPVPIAMTVGYQYGANAQPTPPLTAPVSVLTPLYLGLSPGSVGLYQLNFAVPSPPPGTPACSSTVQSNLTVSVVGVDSSDAAAICVTP